MQLVEVPGLGAGGSSGALEAAAGAGAVAAPPLEGATRPTTVGMPEPLWAYMAKKRNPNVWISQDLKVTDDFVGY